MRRGHTHHFLFPGHAHLLPPAPTPTPHLHRTRYAGNSTSCLPGLGPVGSGDRCSPSRPAKRQPWRRRGVTRRARGRAQLSPCMRPPAPSPAAAPRPPTRRPRTRGLESPGNPGSRGWTGRYVSQASHTSLSLPKKNTERFAAPPRSPAPGFRRTAPPLSFFFFPSSPSPWVSRCARGGARTRTHTSLTAGARPRASPPPLPRSHTHTQPSPLPR
jgi:hypothetical protein